MGLDALLRVVLIVLLMGLVVGRDLVLGDVLLLTVVVCYNLLLSLLTMHRLV